MIKKQPKFFRGGVEFIIKTMIITLLTPSG